MVAIVSGVIGGRQLLPLSDSFQLVGQPALTSPNGSDTVPPSTANELYINQVLSDSQSLTSVI